MNIWPAALLCIPMNQRCFFCSFNCWTFFMTAWRDRTSGAIPSRTATVSGLLHTSCWTLRMFVVISGSLVPRALVRGLSDSAWLQSEEDRRQKHCLGGTGTRGGSERGSHTSLLLSCAENLFLINLSWTQETAGSIPVGSVFCSGAISWKPPTPVICKARTGQTSLPTVVLVFVPQNQTPDCRVRRPDWFNRQKQKTKLPGSFLTAKQAERAAGLGRLVEPPPPTSWPLLSPLRCFLPGAVGHFHGRGLHPCFGASWHTSARWWWLPLYCKMKMESSLSDCVAAG